MKMCLPILLCACFFSPSTIRSAQLPSRVERCLGYPTLAHELETDFRKPGESAAEQATGGNLSRAFVDRVRFSEETPVPPRLRELIVREAKRHRFYADEDRRWFTEFAENFVRQTLQDAGYFKAEVRIEPTFLRKAQLGEHYALSIWTDAGPRHRLVDIRLAGNKAISSEELRKLFPIRDGGVFRTSAIRSGLDAVNKRYGTIGYIDESAEPAVDIIDDPTQVSLLIKVDEEKQYHIGTVAVFTRDPEVARRARAMLVTGAVFSTADIKAFFRKNRLLLPEDASTKRDVEIRRNMADATLSIRLDLWACSEDNADSGARRQSR
jgi:hypothetical protein